MTTITRQLARLIKRSAGYRVPSDHSLRKRANRLWFEMAFDELDGTLPVTMDEVRRQVVDAARNA